MQQVEALSDILPPPAPPAPLPADWWAQPLVAWLAVLSVLILLILLRGWWQRRRWRRLARAVERAADACAEGSVSSTLAAGALAAALRQVLPEPAWPAPVRGMLDHLRYAARPARAGVQQLAWQVQVASRVAMRRAWWSAARARRGFAQALAQPAPGLAVPAAAMPAARA